jgi:hypothetical protein
VFVASIFPEAALGILLFSPDQGLRSVMRLGDPAPGGGTFSGLSPFPFITLDAGGQVAFANSVSDPAGTGAFLFGDQNREVIARDGDPAPGGDTFTSVLVRN